jgi:hypothetical protein
VHLCALAAYAAAVFLAIQWIVRTVVPRASRRWTCIPLVVLSAVLPFVDELYNEQQARLACAQDGGLAVSKTIFAQSPQEGAASIETRKVDSEDAHYWRHEMLFIHRPSGDELARLRWFERKHGWLQGNEPDSGYGRFLNASPCPDPQPYLAGGKARSQLVNARASAAEPAMHAPRY